MPIPAAARAVPASQAPSRASDRAARSAGVGHRPGQAAVERPGPLLGQQRGDRVGAGRVQGLDAVGEGVHAARPGHLGRQAGGEGRVVHHRPGQDPRVAAGALALGAGQPVDRGHLGAGVGGGHGHDRDLVLEGHRLGHAGGRPAAHGDQAVGAGLGGRGHRPGGRLHRDVLLDVGEAGRPAAAEPLHQAVDGPLAGDGQHPAGPQPVDLLAQVLDRADAEHDPAGQRVVREGGEGGHGARLIAERSREVKAAETRRVRHQRGYQTGRSASTLTQTDLGSV